MLENSPRRFNLGDAMVMIAAITPSLVLIRIGARLGVFEVDNRSPVARQLVEFCNLGGGCILAGLVPTVLTLGLYWARPGRKLPRGPVSSPAPWPWPPQSCRSSGF